MMMIKHYLSRIKVGNYLPQILQSKERVYLYTLEEHREELKEMGIVEGLYLKFVTEKTNDFPAMAKLSNCYSFVKSAAEKKIHPNIKKFGLQPLSEIPRKKDFIKHNKKEIEELFDSFDENDYHLFLKILFAYDQGDTSFLFKNISKIENMYLETDAQPFLKDKVISGGISHLEEVIKFLRKIGPSGFLYGFEPSEIKFNELSKQTLESKNYLIKKLALSNKNESMAKFSESGADSRLSSKGKSEAPTTTIDSFLNGEEINLIKLNTNGTELDIIKGSDSTLKNYKPKLQINLIPDNLVLIPYFLRRFGYHLKVYYYDKSKLLNNIILYFY